MVRIYKLVVIVVIALFASFGCGGGSTTAPYSPSPSTPTTPSPTPAPGLPNGSMTATIDGSPWSATGFLSVQYQPNVAPFVIIGSDSQATNIARIVTIAPSAYRTGTFTACPDLSCAFLNLQVNGDVWPAGPVGGSSGTIFLSVLTAHNAIGTFSFIGVGANNTKKSVTNGAFNVTY